MRYRVHFMRDALMRAGKDGRRVVCAFVASTFSQTTSRRLRGSGAPLPTSSTLRRPRLSPSWRRLKLAFSPHDPPRTTLTRSNDSMAQTKRSPRFRDSSQTKMLCPDWLQPE